MARQGSVSQVLASHPIRLHWAGWESTTQALYAAGWELSAREDIFNQTMQVVFRKPDFDITGGSEIIGHVPYGAISASLRGHWDAMNHHARWANDVRARATLARRPVLRIEHNPSLAFTAIDALAQFRDFETEVSMDSVAHFMPHAGKELYLPDQEVGELLDRILAKQIPVQQALAMERVHRRVAAKIIGVQA